MAKKQNDLSQYETWVDLAKEIVRRRDKEGKKIHTIANELGLPENRVILLAVTFDRAMRS